MILLALPNEILERIFYFIDGSTALIISKMSKRLNSLILSSNFLWERYCFVDYDYGYNHTYSLNNTNECFPCFMYYFYIKIMRNFCDIIERTGKNTKRNGMYALLAYIKLKNAVPHLYFSLMSSRSGSGDVNYIIHNILSVSITTDHTTNCKKPFYYHKLNTYPNEKNEIAILDDEYLNLSCELCHGSNPLCLPFLYTDRGGDLFYTSCCMKRIRFYFHAVLAISRFTSFNYFTEGPICFETRMMSASCPRRVYYELDIDWNLDLFFKEDE